MSLALDNHCRDCGNLSEDPFCVACRQMRSMSDSQWVTFMLAVDLVTLAPPTSLGTALSPSRRSASRDRRREKVS